MISWHEALLSSKAQRIRDYWAIIYIFIEVVSQRLNHTSRGSYGPYLLP
jgi:hypothetical protein